MKVDGKVVQLIVVEGGTKGMEGMDGDEPKTAQGMVPIIQRMMVPTFGGKLYLAEL